MQEVLVQDPPCFLHMRQKALLHDELISSFHGTWPCDEKRGFQEESSVPATLWSADRGPPQCQKCKMKTILEPPFWVAMAKGWNVTVNICWCELASRGTWGRLEYRGVAKASLSSSLIKVTWRTKLLRHRPCTQMIVKGLSWVVMQGLELLEEPHWFYAWVQWRLECHIDELFLIRGALSLLEYLVRDVILSKISAFIVPDILGLVSGEESIIFMMSRA